MSVRLFARGSDGVVVIANGAANETTFQGYVNKPGANISQVFFHSNFDYMQLANKFTASITLPARSKAQRSSGGKKSYTYDIPSAGSQRHTLGYHGLGYVPFATATRGSNQVTPTAPIQNVGPSQRLINVEMDSSYIYVYENWTTYIYDLSSVTDTYTVWVFRNPA